MAGWRGDIAIDELHFTPGLCPIIPIGDIAAGSIPTPPVPTTALLAIAPPYSKKLFLSKHIRKIVYHNQFRIPGKSESYLSMITCMLYKVKGKDPGTSANTDGDKHDAH